VKRRKSFFPSLHPPFPFAKSTPFEFQSERIPLCLRIRSKSSFFSPGPSPHNDPCDNNPHERTNPIEIFFLRTNTLLDWTDRTLPRNPMLPVNSVLPWIVFATPPCSPNHLPYAFSIQPPSISVFAPKKLVSFGLLSFTAPAQLIRGHFALLAPPPYPTTPTSTNVKNPLLGRFALFPSSFSLHYHYSILRSSLFCFLGILKTDPNHSSCPPPPPPCRFVSHVCVWHG
jgi:hypothetical protein